MCFIISASFFFSCASKFFFTKKIRPRIPNNPKAWFGGAIVKRVCANNKNKRCAEVNR